MYSFGYLPHQKILVSVIVKLDGLSIFLVVRERRPFAKLVRLCQVTGDDVRMQSWLKVAQNLLVDPVCAGYFQQCIPHEGHVVKVFEPPLLIQGIQIWRDWVSKKQ